VVPVDTVCVKEDEQLHESGEVSLFVFPLSNSMVCDSRVRAEAVSPIYTLLYAIGGDGLG
jgi:hypothetical protein